MSVSQVIDTLPRLTAADLEKIEREIGRIRGQYMDPELESVLAASWEEHLKDPSKSRPAREVIAELMNKAKP